MSKDAPKIAIRTKSESLASKYTVMFDSDIEESSEFHEQFYIMEQAGKDDLVDVCISSLGGSVATISKFQDVVKNSEAHFHAKLHGYGYSAGGALFLLCDTQEVSDLATFMAHSIQSGYGGGTQALEAHSKMTSEHNRTLCEMLYTDFLSPEEINRICDGAEIWMAAPEIRERLEKREAIRQQQAVDEAKETYTPEVYAEQCVLDITEDCEGFGYDAVDIITAMLEKIKGTMVVPEELLGMEEEEENILCKLFEEGEYKLEVRSDGKLNDFSDEPLFTSFKEIVDNGDIGLTDLKGWAKALAIKFAHNISEETLVKRVDEKIAEIRETLVD